MTWQQLFVQAANDIAVPAAAVVLGLAGLALQRLAAFLQEKTHNALVCRVVEGASRSAADVAAKVAAMPAGSDLNAVKAEALADGAQALRAQFSDTLAKIKGTSPPDLEGMISGELNKQLLASPTVPAVSPIVPVPPTSK